MTNEEITQDILEHCMSGEVIKQSMYVGCMQMAERKDAQLKEYLEKKHEEFTIKGTWENSYDWGRRSAIEEIIKELFNE